MHKNQLECNASTLNFKLLDFVEKLIINILKKILFQLKQIAIFAHA